MAVLRRLRRLLRGVPLVESGNEGLFDFHRQSYVAATFTVRLLYVATLWPVLSRLVANWLSWRSAGELSLVWPVAWFALVDPALGADLIGGLTLISAVLVVFFPEKRAFRILAFVGFFIFVAFGNSFGKINHDLHGWMAMLFGFMFIPAGSWKLGEKSVRFRQHFLTAVWFGMALMSLFYTMSGIFKVYGIWFEVSHGLVSALHPYGLAYQVMGRLLQTNTTSLFGPLLLDFPWVGWPMYIVAIYLELLALAAVFRPRLHLVWGLGLMGMHLGNWLLLSVAFTANIFLLAFMFVNSPFRPSKFDVVATAYDLPAVGWLLRQVVRRIGYRATRGDLVG